MTEQILKEENLHVIKEIEANPNTTQRTISRKLGISLGKTNYILKELIKKGFIKGRSFSNNPGKIKKINYLLTEKGFRERMLLLEHFLKRKESEYNQLKTEFEQLSAKK